MTTTLLAAPARDKAQATTCPPLDGGPVLSVVRALVRRQAKLFAAFPGYGLDDLDQEALLAVHRAWPRFDPSKSSVATFAHLVANRRLLSPDRGQAR